MKVLKTIYEKDVISGGGEVSKDIDYTIRESARAVVVNNENKIAMLHVGAYDYYKLPGGGLESGEDFINGLKREVREEVGCEIEITGEVGEIIEYRNQGKYINISNCYTAKIEGSLGETKFDQHEKEQKFELLWVKIDEAIKLLLDTKTDHYYGKFITYRDLEFLKAYQEKYKDI